MRLPMVLSSCEFRLTREGIGAVLTALAILGASFIQQVNLLTFLFCALLTPIVLGAFLAARGLRNVRASRHAPWLVEAGTTFAVEWSLSTPASSPSAMSATIADRLEPADAQVAGTLEFAWLTAGIDNRQRYEAHVARRGVYRFAPATLSTAFPFGFIRCSRTLADPRTLVVHPRLGVLTTRWRAMTDPTWTEARQSRRLAFGHHEEFRSLREYRAGDNPRHIHWRTTARRGEAMIKEFEAPERASVLIVIEPWTPRAPLPQQADWLETAFSFAGTLGVEILRRPGAILRLAIASDPAIYWQGGNGRRSAEEFLRLLSEAKGDPDADASARLADLPRAFASPARLWIVGARPFSDRVERLLAPFDARRALANATFVNVAAGEEERWFHLPAPSNAPPRD